MISDYLSLLKPRILVMQFVSFGMGFLLAIPMFHPSLSTLCWGLIGVSFVSGGAAALNHAIEATWDALMKRTQTRPIPSGRISKQVGILFGLILILVGLSVLGFKVNLLTSGLAALTAFLYVCVYTPLKRKTIWNTYWGTLPGALPPLGGWAAAANGLSLEALLMGLVLLVWQLPHFFAIAWMYKDDYEQGGFKMVSGGDSGPRTVFHMKLSSWVLMVVGILPFLCGILGWISAVVAVLLAAWLLREVYQFSHQLDYLSAKKVMRVSLIYLPLFLLGIGLDRLIL